MNMLEVYQHVLNTCGYLVDEEGRVRKEVNDKTFPVSIDIEGESRIVVLPTRANLTSPDILRFVVFHPMQENLMRGESKLLSFIRKELNRRYGTSLAYLMNELVKISSGSVNHTELTPAQRDIISRFGKTDQKFQDSFFKIIIALGKSRSKNNTVATLSLRKGFTIDGTSFSRVAIWSFPLADEVYKVIDEVSKKKDYQPKIFGVPVRKGDLPILKNICEVFFPNSQEVDKHGFYGASDATDAPFFEAFVRSLLSLPKHTNHIAEVFFKGKNAVVSKEVAQAELAATTLDISWIKDGFTVSDYRKEYLMVPPQDGNEGVAAVEKEKQINVNPQATQAKINWETVSQPLQGNPAQVAQPVQAPIQAPIQPVQQVQPQTVSQPQGNQFIQPRQVYQVPLAPVYQQPQPVMGNNQFLAGQPQQPFNQYPPQGYQAVAQPVNNSGWGFAQPQTYQQGPAHHQFGMLYQPGMARQTTPQQMGYQSLLTPRPQYGNTLFR